MRAAIQRVLAEIEISAGPRVVLEAAAAIFARSGGVETTSEALLAEIAARERRAMAPATFRKRLSRLNAILDQAGAPFELRSSNGRITAQPNARRDAELAAAALDRELGAFSAEGTAIVAGVSVSPRAAPEKPRKLLVMFSYAWLDQDELGRQLHRIQDRLYNTLENRLALPSAKYRDLPPIRLWRDMKRNDPSDQGNPQMEKACRDAFLCLLLLSHRYPHRDACLREAAHFLTETGENQPGKRCIVIPVDVTPEDVPVRFSAGIRPWLVDDAGKSLVEVWDGGSSLKRQLYVRKIVDRIFEAARLYLAEAPRPLGAVPVADAETGDEPMARRARELSDQLLADQQDARDALPPRAAQARLGAEIRAASSTAEPAGIDIVPVLADWACSGEGARLTALLGEFGMGKTVTCQLVTQELLERRDRGAKAPLPLFFDLRNVESAGETGPGTLERIIGDLLRRAGETVLDAKEVIAHIRRTGAAVIFDGIDEVTNKLSAEQAIRFYRELLTIVPGETWRADAERRRQIKRGAAEIPAAAAGPRLLVSCRSHYFRDLATQRGFLAGQDRAGIAADDDIQAYVMLPFSDEQITTYLDAHLGGPEGKRAWELIGETYNLHELAERPILLRFIGDSFLQLEEEKQAGNPINITRIYDIFVAQTFARDDPKHVIPLREKRLLLADLALEMQRSGVQELSHDTLDDWFIRAAPRYPRLAAALAGVEGLGLSEIFLQDLRNASLLVRPSESGFRFGHASIREYFLADAIVKAIGDGRGEDLDIPVPTPETLTFVLARLEIAEAPIRRGFRANFPSLLVPGRILGVRAFAFALWRHSAYLLPRPAELDLSGLDFYDDRFTGSDGQRVPLQNSRWQGARLNMVEFDRVDLSDADFSGVEAWRARILACRLDRTLFRATDLQGSIWRDLDLSTADFKDADLRDANAASCVTDAGSPWRTTPRMELHAFRILAAAHSGPISAIALGAVAGRMVVVSGGDDGSVRLWDAASSAPLATLSGHVGWVSSVALGAVAGRMVVVSGGVDGSVRLWDAASSAPLATLSGHEGWVSSVALGAVAGRMVVVSGGEDGSVRLWDAASSAPLATLSGHEGRVNSVALGAVAGRMVVVSGGDDGSVRLWDAASSAPLATLSGHVGGVSSVALGAVAGRMVVVSGGDDGSVRLWDAASSAPLATLSGHVGWVSSVALGAVAGRMVVVSGGYGGRVRLCLAAGSVPLATLSGHEGGVWSVALGAVAGRVLLGVASQGMLELLTLDPDTFLPFRRVILGPGPDTSVETLVAPDGSETLVSQSADAWRYWRAQGTVDGKLVTIMLDDLPLAVPPAP